jgi:hypothetical protein
MQARARGSSVLERKFAQIARTCQLTNSSSAGRERRAARRDRSRRKCTEPVTPSSGFPTDRRRSGCHSESHQPRALRTRCKPHTRCPPDTRQEAPEAAWRKLRLFLFATGRLRQAALALVTSRDEKAAEPEDAAAELEARRRLQIAEASALPAPERKSSPSRERFRPPSRRTFRFRVVLLGGLRPTGAPCSAQSETYDMGHVGSRGSDEEISRILRPTDDIAFVGSADALAGGLRSRPRGGRLQDVRDLLRL